MSLANTNEDKAVQFYLNKFVFLVEFSDSSQACGMADYSISYTINQVPFIIYYYFQLIYPQTSMGAPLKFWNG